MYLIPTNTRRSGVRHILIIAEKSALPNGEFLNHNPARRCFRGASLSTPSRHDGHTGHSLVRPASKSSVNVTRDPELTTSPSKLGVPSRLTYSVRKGVRPDQIRDSGTKN
jgi:hypothetical protein